jgi:hypothetical protein
VREALADPRLLASVAALQARLAECVRARQAATSPDLTVRPSLYGRACSPSPPCSCADPAQSPVPAPAAAAAVAEIFATQRERPLSSPTDLFRRRRSLPRGCFETRLRGEDGGSRLLRQLLQANQAVRRCIDVTPGGRLVVGEGDRIGCVVGACGCRPRLTVCDSVYDIAPLLAVAGPLVLDKRAARSLGKAQFPSDIHAVSVNPANPNFVAVAGMRHVHVVTLGPGGDVASQLAVELHLEAVGEGVFVRKVRAGGRDAAPGVEFCSCA